MSSPDKDRTESRGRGTDRFVEKFPPGSLDRAIEAAQARSPRPALLEIGCGEGVMLLELMKRCPTFDLEGINKKPWSTMRGSESLAANAKRFGVMSDAEFAKLRLPKIHFLDADEMDFPDESFDLIISQLAIPYVVRKDKLLSNVWRMLRPNGQALLNMDASIRKAPDFLPGETPRFIIYKDGVLFPFRDWIAERAAMGFDAKVTMIHRDDGKRSYLALELTKNKSEPFPIDLEFDKRSSFSLRALLKYKRSKSMTWGKRSVFHVVKPAAR